MMFLDKELHHLIAEFESNLLDTNSSFNYYIDWSNIVINKYTIEIHALDSLIGLSTEFDRVFIDLLDKLPSVIQVFPFLFALSKAERNQVIKGKASLKIIGSSLDGEDAQDYFFSYVPSLTPFSLATKEKYLDFFIKMGLKNLYQTIIEKSTYDYIIGVLVGLDSNGRKNRAGHSFELACEPIIREICSVYDIEVLTQKKFSVLRKKGFVISEDIANRKADFILVKGSKCINIEVNFYNSSGSKPEEIIDSYINRQADLRQNNISFALITDGRCWQGTTNQLSKGFRHLTYLMNYRMCRDGMLLEVIEKVFT